MEKHDSVIKTDQAKVVVQAKEVTPEINEPIYLLKVQQDAIKGRTLNRILR